MQSPETKDRITMLGHKHKGIDQNLIAVPRTCAGLSTRYVSEAIFRSD